MAEAGVFLMKPVSLPPSGLGFSAWFVREMLTSDRNRLGYNSPAACGPQCWIFTVGTTGHCPWVFHGPRESRSWFTWPHDATSLSLSFPVSSFDRFSSVHERFKSAYSCSIQWRKTPCFHTDDIPLLPLWNLRFTYSTYKLISFTTVSIIKASRLILYRK